MPAPTPFHPRTQPLCRSLAWKDWSGYAAVRFYDSAAELEYFAIRHAAAAIDVSALFKVDVEGPDAAALLSRVTVRDLERLAVGRVTYLCWCDDDGKVVDDGTVTRLSERHFRLSAAEPALAWLSRLSRGYRVELRDTSEELAVLAIQGPTSRELLDGCADGDVASLKFFRALDTRIAGAEVTITRTGYTGDLGYEVWIPAERALETWDAIFESGRDHRLTPCGLDAMDMARIEAGFVMNGVDYHSAHHALLDSRKSSPYELGLGWTVQLDREPFVGQQALRRELRHRPRWVTAGLVYHWPSYEALFAEVGLPPQVAPGAWRGSVPVYDELGGQIGYCTSGTWSPTLKQNLAIATLDAALASEAAADGRQLSIEVTVEHRRRRCPARMAPLPFYDPPRKRGRGDEPPRGGVS